METEKKLKTGDVVWLKSGSPKMTVKYLNHTGDWICSWFTNGDAKRTT